MNRLFGAVNLQRRFIRRFFIGEFLLLTTLVFGGCAASRVYENPAGYMMNSQADPDAKLQAARQGAQRTPDDPEYRQALNAWVYDRGYTDEMRRFAIDQLVKTDEARFKQELARRIVLIQNMQTLEYLLDLAVRRQWRDLTPAIVRNYSRRAQGMSDQDRPERKAIQALNPGHSVEDVVFNVFMQQDGTSNSQEQAAAWELLYRLMPTQELLELLSVAKATSPMVQDLKIAAVELGTLPKNRDGVLWLMTLRQPENVHLWNQAKSRIDRLSLSQRQGLQVRHIPILAGDVAAKRLEADHPQLARQLAQRLADADHYLKAPTHDGQSSEYPQTLAHWVDRLVWADLLTIHQLLDGLSDQAMVQSLFEQADADRLDETTELGGVMDACPQWQAILFKPEIRRHDRKFVPSAAMLQRLHTGLAHYHFHAQQYRNRDYAGPGRGDLESADHLQANCLVFTFIDQDRLNVDYYQPGGVAIDLGVIHRFRGSAR